MERKAKLLSPLLVVAMLVSLVAGAVAVVVTPQPAAAAPGPVLSVAITTPGDGSSIDVCQNFLVKAVVTNTGDATATGVTANITFDGTKAEWVAGDGSGTPHTQNLGDLDRDCSVEVMWTLHCRNAGATDITVGADATNAASTADTVTVNQMIRVEIIKPDPDCAGYEVCPSQSFTLRATITNTGDLPVALNRTGAVQVCVSSLPTAPAAHVTVGPTPDPSGTTLAPAESVTVTWTLHCDKLGDDTISVTVFDDSGDLIGYDQYAFHQRGLLVDIVMPEDGDTFCVCNDFYVNAVVTNTCGDVIHDVNVTISGVDVYPGTTYNATLVSGETALKRIGDIPGKLSRDVMWKVHCTKVGDVNISVSATGVTAFGEVLGDNQPTGDVITDSVLIHQGTGLTVDIVEPPFSWSPDGYTVCVCQTFVVKAHIGNFGCNIDATSVTATIGIEGGASVIPEEAGKYPSFNVGDIDVGEEVIVGWTLHCDEPGVVLITVSALSDEGLYGEDSVEVTQGDPTVPDLEVYIIEPMSSTKISTDCNNVFTVTAKVDNPSCATLLNTFAELLWACGPGEVYVNPVDITQPLGNIPGPGSAMASWTVQCTGAGDVYFWVGAWAGNHAWVLSDADPLTPASGAVKGDLLSADWALGYDPVTVHQLDFITQIVDVGALDIGGLMGYPGYYYGVSTCQQFTVTARFENNDGELAEVKAILDYSRIGAVLVDTPVTVTYHRNVTPENPNGEPDPTKPAESIDAIDTVPFGEGLDYGLSTVELSRICRCCYALVTWTLECQGAVSGELEARAQTAGGIFLDNDSVLIQQYWKTHLVAGLEAFSGKLSDKTLITVPEDTFTICQYFTVVATVTNIGQSPAYDVEVEITVDGLVTPSGTLTMAMAAGMAGFLSDPYGMGREYIIPGYESAKVWWELHCDGKGDVSVSVTHLNGKDYLTGVDILPENIDVLCALELHQVVGNLTVEIVQPATCDNFTIGQEFTVKALVTNLGEAAVPVSATIDWTPDAGAVLASGETYLTKDLGTIQPGRTHEVAWVLRCNARGDLTITVDAIVAMPELVVTSEPVIVHQVGPSEIECQIISPCELTAIVTSQEFALTAVITNLPASADVTIDYVSLDIENDPDTGMDFAEIVAGPVPAAPYYLAGGESVIVTWTLHVVSATYDPCLGHVFEICVYASGTDMDWGLPVETECCVDVEVQAAAHLVVNITAPADGTTVSVCDTYTVTATVTNTGWADAWEVSAILSVFPEGSARLALSGTDARAGYTKYIGTLVGYGAAAEGLPQASATVSWVLHCKTACESTITVTAAGRDEIGSCVAQQLGGQCCPCSGFFVVDGVAEVGDPQGGDLHVGAYPGVAIPDWLIEPDSITVKQLEAASLVVANISYPTQVNVCQNFTVDAVVQNVGQATAEDVVATLHISENLDASLAAGTVDTAAFDLAGGAFKLVSWLVHCDGASSGAIAVSAEGYAGNGTKLPSAIAANGSVIQIAVPVPQPCLEVEVDAPAQVTVEQSYYVTAVVSNPCDAEACDVVGTININGNAQPASGESSTHTFGCIDAGDSATWSWKVDCTDVGGVNITVSVKGTGTNTAIDGVAVQQVVFQDILDALENIHTEIVGVRGDIASGVATISTDLGTIQTSLTNIGATVTSIDDGVATIETNLGTLKGTVADISDDVATIVTDLGTVKADVSDIAADTGTLKSRSIWTLPILILVAIGAIAVIVGVAIIASRKRPVPVVIERKGEE